MDCYRVSPDTKIRLSEWDPNDTGDFAGGKKEARRRLKSLSKRLGALQQIMYAEHKHKLLVVLQAMDTGGKDSTIRRVFSRVNPQGISIANFKVPTREELDHDYLWRVHQHTPATGQIVVFNRSHYEDVLVVRVHQLVPPEIWSRRYDHMNAFEKTLAEEGTTIVKFYLHIDAEAQRHRLQSRLDKPKKQWKFSLGDLKERKLWPDYMRAYEDVLSKTSTEWAPWYIVPANRKWYRNLVVATVLTETLEGLNMSYPEPEEDLSNVVIE